MKYRAVILCSLRQCCLSRVGQSVLVMTLKQITSSKTVMKFHVIEKKKKRTTTVFQKACQINQGYILTKTQPDFPFLSLLLLIPLSFSQDRRFHRASHYKWTLRFQMKALVKHPRIRTESILLHSWPGSRVVVPLFVKNEPTLLLRICRCN